MNTELTEQRIEGDQPSLKPSAAAADHEMSPTLDHAAVRSSVQAIVGKAVLGMMGLDRYRRLPIGDLSHIVIDPLLRDRVAVFGAINGTVSEAVAIAIWASVTESADQKIKEQIETDSFPIRLAPEDWASGDKLWLIDVIAPTREHAIAAIRSFKRIVQDREFSVHPVLSRSFDRATFASLSVQAPASSAEGGKGPTR